MRPARTLGGGFGVLRTYAVCALAVLCTGSALNAQQFPNPRMLVTSPDPVGLITADFNGDGHQDLAYVTTGRAPILQVLLGDGQGGFTEGASVQLPTGACTFEVVTCRMVLGDFTHNGHIDILMPWNVYSDWGFLVVPGNGDGTFGSPVVSTIPRSSNPGLDTFVPVRYAVGDFNGDGNLDIAAPDYQDIQIRVYLGDGKGNFTAGPTPIDPNSPYAAYATDLNHDGHLDLIVFTRYGGGAEIWIGDGTGNFKYSKSYPVPTGMAVFRPLSAADINGDGNLDVLGMDGTGDIEVLTGNADGSFNSPQVVASGFEGPDFLYTADLTGSGIPSLIGDSNYGFDTAVATGNMAYGPVQKRTSGPFETDAVFADFNGDGAPDMAVGVSGGIQFFFGNHTGLFPDSTITPIANPATFVFAGDFNGDGISDVAAIGADGYIRTYGGSKSGTLGSPVKTGTAITSSFDYIGNAVGDFDGDGHQDIAMIGQVLYGNGDGTFTPVSETTVSIGSGGAISADLNKDGKSDLLSISGPIAVAGANTYVYSLLAELGTAQRGFTPVTTTFPPYGLGRGIVTPALLAVGDLNGDGFPDAAVYDPNIPALEIWLGNGDGSFHSGSSINLQGSLWMPEGSGGQLSSLGVGAIGDLDGDGNADLAFVASEGVPASGLTPEYVLVVAYGDGKGGFGTPQVISLSHPAGSVAIAKLDSGPLPGIIVGEGNLVTVLRNLGKRQFSNEEFYTAGTFDGLLPGDFNGDGLADLLPTRANGLYNPPGSMTGLTVLLNQSEAGGSGSGIVNGALTATPAVVNYNQAFALSAVVAAATSGAPAPTGTVSFYALGLPLGSAPLNQGSATLQVPGSLTQLLPQGLVELTANYSGDTYYAAADLATTLQVLNPVYATQTTMTIGAAGASVSSIQAASFITMNATVTAPVTVPSGHIAFFDGSNVLGQAEIIKGQASFSTNLLVIGNHSLSAQYLGYMSPGALVGPSFMPSTSPAADVTVTAVPTAVTLSSSTSTGTTGTVLSLTADLTSPAGPPIGGVTFFDGSTALGTLGLDFNGTATFSTASLSAGQHSFTAQYAANGIFAGSVSSTSVVTLYAPSPTLAPTVTQIDSVLPSVTSGNEVTVQVTGNPDHAGAVSVLIDGRLAATAALTANGLAVVPLAMSSTGIHTLVASYSGSALAAPSASSPLSATAFSGGKDFTLRAAQTRFAQGAGGSLLPIPLSIGAIDGWNGTVVLRCVSGLPTGYSCSFSPPSVSGSGIVTLTLQPSGAGPLAALLLVPCVWILRKKSRRVRLLMVLLAGVAFLPLSSCSASRNPATTYVVTVEADSGSLVHSVQIQTSIHDAR